MQPDHRLPARIREALELGGDRVSDLHLWRLGPGHLGLIAVVVSEHPAEPSAYKRRLAGLSALSHVTIEVHHCPDHAREAA
jgi:Co/Zn/Cd efflux system component